MCERRDYSEWEALADRAWVRYYVLFSEQTPGDIESMNDQFEYHSNLCGVVLNAVEIQPANALLIERVETYQKLIQEEQIRRTDSLGSEASSVKWVLETAIPALRKVIESLESLP